MFWSGRKERFQQAAAALGMSLDSDHMMSGWWQREVAIKLTHATEKSGDNRVKVTYADASIDPPLLLGLKITKRSAVFGGLGDALALGDFEIGDKMFDAEARVYAPDPEYISQFLHGPLTGPLTQAFRLWSGLQLTDERLRIRIRGHESEPETLRSMLSQVGSLAAALIHHKAGSPLPTWHQRVEQTWGSFAKERRLHFDVLRSRLRGHLARDVEAWVQFRKPARTPELLETHLRVEIPAAAIVGLQLKPETGTQTFFKLFGAQDVKTGDEAFDDAFVIKAADEEAAKYCLQERAREKLLEIRARADAIELDEAGLHIMVRRVVTYGIDEMIDHAVGAAMSIRRESPEQAGPYR